MYAQYENGVLIQGAAVFPEAYRRANLPFLAWPFSRKALQPFLSFSYQIFAKNRHAISNAIGLFALRLVQKK